MKKSFMSLVRARAAAVSLGVASLAIPCAAAADDLPVPVTVERLDNGLRVVMSPDHNAPTVAVAVYYDVGARVEERGRSGFAHLFEHMMFEGSANVGKGEHFRLISRAAGSSTAPPAKTARTTSRRSPRARSSSGSSSRPTACARST